MDIYSANHNIGIVPNGEKAMSQIPTDWMPLAGIVGILAFLWKLGSDIADLRDRMARLEWLFEGFRSRNDSENQRT